MKVECRKETTCKSFKSECFKVYLYILISVCIFSMKGRYFSPSSRAHLTVFLNSILPFVLYLCLGEYTLSRPTKKYVYFMKSLTYKVRETYI